MHSDDSDSIDAVVLCLFSLTVTNFSGLTAGSIKMHAVEKSGWTILKHVKRSLLASLSAMIYQLWYRYGFLLARNFNSSLGFYNGGRSKWPTLKPYLMWNAAGAVDYGDNIYKKKQSTKRCFQQPCSKFLKVFPGTYSDDNVPYSKKLSFQPILDRVVCTLSELVQDCARFLHI